MTTFAVIALTLLAPQADPEPSIVTLVKSKIVDPATPFTIRVAVQVKKGQNAAFEAAHAAAATPSLKEDGCKAYDLNRATDGSQDYFLYERFTSVSALELHMTKAYTQKLVGAFPTYFDGAAKVEIFAIPGLSAVKAK